MDRDDGFRVLCFILTRVSYIMSEKTYYTYILASEKNGTLYVGVTSDLEKRIVEHKTKTFKGFTEKYDVNMLVYCDISNDVHEAIAREKQLKKWNRKWKLDLIEKSNPEWKDLSEDWFDWKFKGKELCRNNLPN